MSSSTSTLTILFLTLAVLSQGSRQGSCNPGCTGCMDFGRIICGSCEGRKFDLEEQDCELKADDFSKSHCHRYQLLIDFEGAVVTCAECEKGYYFSYEEDQCVLIPQDMQDQVDPKCLYYENNEDEPEKLVCLECQGGYPESAESAKCTDEKLPSNCVTGAYDNLEEKSQCFRCKKGYARNQNDECVISKIEGCWFYSEGKCGSCRGDWGYYQAKPNGPCIKMDSFMDKNLVLE